MARNCPICNSDKFKVVWRDNYLTPDGWTLPPYLDWKRCECGMIYGDNPNTTQHDYDVYYDQRYGYGVSAPDTTARLLERANFVADKFPNKKVRIVDFGGGDSGFSDMMNDRGYANVHNYTIGRDMPQHADVILAEHVLEHVYDIDEAMEKITGALKPSGMLIVDIPDAGLISLTRSEKTPILDYHRVHLNHFRLVDILTLCKRYGYELLETRTYPERGLPCRMLVFIKDAEIVASLSKWTVTHHIQDKVAKLRGLSDDPVCVWGFGDIAAMSLEGWLPNVQYFVCNDPAFIGATIQGIPVYDAPIDDIPVIVIAQSQKEKLINHIKEVCTNRIIEI